MKNSYHRSEKFIYAHRWTDCIFDLNQQKSGSFAASDKTDKIKSNQIQFSDSQQNDVEPNAYSSHRYVVTIIVIFFVCVWFVNVGLSRVLSKSNGTVEKAEHSTNSCVHMCMHRLKKHKRKKEKTTFNDLFSLHSLGILICFFVRSFFLSFSRVVVVICVLSVVLLCSKCASLKWKEIMRSHARAHTHSTHNTHHSFNFLIHFSCDRVCTASSLRFFLFCSTLNEKQNYQMFAISAVIRRYTIELWARDGVCDTPKCK